MAGQYFLVQESPATATLPGADFVDPTPISLAAGAGKVALVNGVTSLGCNGSTTLFLDLAPGRDPSRLERELTNPRAGRSLSEHLRRQVGINGAKAALIFEILGRHCGDDIPMLARTIKRLPLRLVRARPLAEAISTAGGVRLDAMDASQMLRAMPGVFCAGEMLDWEAPTGGYLLTACFASGRLAGLSAAEWLAGCVTRAPAA